MGLKQNLHKIKTGFLMAVLNNVATIPASLPPLNLRQVIVLVTSVALLLLGKFELKAVVAELGNSLLFLVVVTRREDLFALPYAFGRAWNPFVVVVQTRATMRRNNVRKV